MPVRLNAGLWPEITQPTTQGRGKVAPPPRNHGAGEGMNHSQYAPYMKDRDTRFSARRLRRRGFDFDDPFLVLLLADAALECDEWPCADYP